MATESVRTRLIMEVSEGEKALLLALRRAGLTIQETGRQQSDALNAALRTTLAALPTPQSDCGLTDRRGWVCRKPHGHAKRHQYREVINPSRHIPPQITWMQVKEVPVKSGTRTFILKIGGPCSVRPSPDYGTVQTTHGWTVTDIQTHPDGRVNVGVVQKKTGKAKIVPLARIVYKRPAKAAP